MIPRIPLEKITRQLNRQRAIIIYGPRQCGKTTLLNMLTPQLNGEYLWLNGDDNADAALLSDNSRERLKRVIGKNKYLIIDEAQEIEQIGKKIKIIIDALPGICPILSGSSAFELANKMNEPLTGRKFEIFLFPVAFSEMSAYHGLRKEIQQLESRLIFGSYPEIVMNPGQEKELLKELSSSYLYKDVFKYGNIRKPKELEKIVTLLAWQLGSEVNISELAREAGTSSHTVERYLDLLQKSYIIIELPAFSRNHRNEIKKNKKIYFIDNGIRNTLVGNLDLLATRSDAGALWENYLVSERHKLNAFKGFHGYKYFWRTKQQQEIDYLEESDGKIDAFEFKWNPAKKAKIPLTFTKNYPVNSTTLVNPDNYELFLNKD
ncbi:MAG: ATP-binding protein [Bacteroidales bacterium]|nr:ATP-binding protein [Bacteroidales bacterium]